MDGTRHRPLRSALSFLALLTLALSLVVPSSAEAAVRRCEGKKATHVGTGSSDVLRGTPKRDVFVGLGGADRLVGRGGNDIFCAGPGGDVLLGGPGGDLLLGQGGNDSLNGGRGNDELDGGGGTDECTNGEVVVNCEDGEEPPPPPPPEFDVDGSWSGTTSQDKEIAFDVQDHALTFLEISYSWAGPGCSSEGTTTVNFVNPLPIQDNQFHYQAAFGSFSVDVQGTFTSDTEANGTFAVSDSGGFCPGAANGTWDAAKA